jgi:hypothetical protein
MSGSICRRLAATLVAGVSAGVLLAQSSGRIASGTSADVAVDAVPVPLNPIDPSRTAIGDFVYAGGLQLTARPLNRLHELSDLVIIGTDRFSAVGDGGVRVDGRLVLDAGGRLIGAADVRINPLTGEDGKPLTDPDDRDAEGIARLANGDWLISFERRQRIWLYPASGGPPRPIPSPNVRLPWNQGLEAISADPDAGPDSYVVGAEQSGETWTCRLSLPACVKSLTVEKPPDFGLASMRRLPRGLTAYLLRAYDPKRGPRIMLKIQRGSAVVAEMEMARPETVDNFEALGVVVREGVIRFYLASDDNASPTQRTLLVAFDWRLRT